VRSADASSQIAEIINGSVVNVAKGVGMVQKTESALKEIGNSVSEVSSIVENIATSAVEQASGISDISQAISGIDSVTQQNATLVDQNSNSMRLLAANGRSLSELTSFFRLNSSPTPKTEDQLQEQG